MVAGVGVIDVVVILSCAPLIAYGLLNVLFPTVTARWQASATSRRTGDDPRRHVGLAFARLAGASAGGLARLRLIGVAEIAVGAVVILAVVG